MNEGRNEDMYALPVKLLPIWIEQEGRLYAVLRRAMDLAEGGAGKSPFPGLSLLSQIARMRNGTVLHN